MTATLTREFAYDDSTEIVASSRIDLHKAYDAKYLRAVVSSGRATAAQPWKWYNEIGAISFGIGRGAHIAGYAKINAHKLEKDGTPGEVVTSGRAAEIAARLSSPYGGQRGLIERFFTLMKVPGEGYLVRCRDGEDGDGDIEGYDFLSSDEIARESTDGSQLWTPGGDRPIRTNQAIKRITLPKSASANGEELYRVIKPDDFIGRVWRPANRYVEQAVSPMRALDTECELLHLLTIGLKAKLTSRLALNGIFFVPSEINDIRSGATEAAGMFHENRVIDRLIAAASWAVLNHEKAEAAIPIFMSGPAQYADAIKHIVMDREVYATDMALRAELRDTILTGLDVQKQKTKGDGDSNHFQAWADDGDEMRVNIKPDLEMLCWALTRMVLYREMQDAEVADSTINQYCLWYDISAANVNTNLAEDARQASDRIWISPEAGRRLTGMDEADAPTPEEYVRGVGVKMSDPYLATFKLDIAKEIDWDKVGKTKTGPDAQSQGDKPKSGPGVGSPGSPGDNRSDTPKKDRPT